MTDALIALHFQNDICHPHGRIPFSLRRATAEASAFIEASRAALEKARSGGLLVAHVHIAFAKDYSDLPRNCPLFAEVERLGALTYGSWGAAAFAGFEPKTGELALIHRSNSAFRGTGLEERLASAGVRRLQVMGLATQFSVEHTVRDAADIGYAVSVLSRCCASADAEAHAASLRTMAMLADIV
jgi:nicotinamidase-related amidase